MRDFKARIEGLNDGVLHSSQFGADGYPNFGLQPGVLLELQADGTLKKFSGTITEAVKHKLYYCNSWSHAVNKYANSTVSIIPIATQFEYEVTLDAADITNENELKPGVIVAYKSAKFAVAGATDYVIGAVRAGTANATKGGTITIETWGGNYTVPAT